MKHYHGHVPDRKEDHLHSHEALLIILSLNRYRVTLSVSKKRQSLLKYENRSSKAEYSPSFYMEHRFETVGSCCMGYHYYISPSDGDMGITPWTFQIPYPTQALFLNFASSANSATLKSSRNLRCQRPLIAFNHLIHLVAALRSSSTKSRE